jgi:diguanylate cyclase (GGDEF)-like protein
LGGEEFLLIWPNVGLQECARMAERLRKLSEQMLILVEGKVIQVTISVGVACWYPDIHDVEQLLGKPDMALYEAKNSGRNRMINFAGENHVG